MQKFILSDITPLPFEATITGQDARHIFKVLRLDRGAAIPVTDGRGNDYTAKILDAGPAAVTIRVFQKNLETSESPLELTLCSGMLKDKKMDMVIKHVTQLGIDKWIPVFCGRSVPRPDPGRIKKRWERWQAISRESLKQCGRSRLVKISEPLPFKALKTVSQAYDHKIAFWEKSSCPLTAIKKKAPPQKAIILIGPEGGFTNQEIRAAESLGFNSFSLGPRILRSETAAISSCTLIQHILGDI